MVNYQNGKIYKIENNVNNDVYIGSTAKQYLSQRMQTHKSNYVAFTKGLHTKSTVFDMFGNVGFNNCQIVLIESFPCNSKDELHARETHYIKNTICMNKVLANGSPINKDTLLKVDDPNLTSKQRRDLKSRHKHEVALKAKKNEKFDCECGGKYTKSHQSLHRKSIKHMNYVENL
jgi:hypothetical protein